MIGSCNLFVPHDSSTANLFSQQNSSSGVCHGISVASKFEAMTKPTRTPITPEQKAEADRLKAIFSQRKDEARARGEKLTQDDVAAACGWSGQSAVSQYMSGRIALNIDALLKLSRALNFEPTQVSPRLAKGVPASPVAALPKIESNVGPAPKMEGYVPVISWVQAGAWTEVDNVEIIPEEYVPRPPGASDRTFALRVRGQSMLPKYEPGLIIYVDPEVLPFDGDDVVAMLNQHGECEATFKQLVEEPGMRLLKARNPAWPDPWIEINGHCEIIGVVIGALWLRAPR